MLVIVESISYVFSTSQCVQSQQPTGSGLRSFILRPLLRLVDEPMPVVFHLHAPVSRFMITVHVLLRFSAACGCSTNAADDCRCGPVAREYPEHLRGRRWTEVVQ